MSTAHQTPSSNSTTPPSEATLDDEFANRPEIRSSKLKQNFLSGSPAQEDGNSLEQGLNDANHDPFDAGSTDTMVSNSIHENPEYALLAYARTNNVAELARLLEAHYSNELRIDLNFKGNQKQNFGWSALHLACYFGHEQVVDLLLSSEELRDEININIRNSSGDTPLHKATLTNRVRIVQILLSNKANVFIKNCDGLLAKQLTNDKHIYAMLIASEQADKNLLKQNMFKAVDNGDLKKLQNYFREYDTMCDAPDLGLAADSVTLNNQTETNDESNQMPSTSTHDDSRTAIRSVDFINKMTDDRGNTLLHLAAMRGFKAICVYLLELGFDPYKKNNLGQTCIELTSYQLRQLFINVKPADNQIKNLSKERVTRFEGPLLRKVRILGWKHMYVVLENGVILLFNNRRDSMNKSRRGYKYLESAICEPEPADLGMFTLRFSDNSRATFLVSPNHLSYYTTFNLSLNNSDRQPSGNQIELVRQKWIDSVRDHITYSTEFIRKGLKLDDDEEVESMNYDGSSLASLNHLLPIDTIKSFVQEARAHYSILERHAESLCNLAQSVNMANQRTLTNSYERGSGAATASSSRWTPQPVPAPPPPSLNESDNVSTITTTTTSNTATGSRILGFIRPNRQARASLVNDSDFTSLSRSQTAMLNNSLLKARNSAASNEFLQDNWPCLLFHLRLLMESTENTKTSMGQVLALMEHQEQLRQNRIQDQEERCRVLEDSLQTLARDHHELEKSLSMSQIFHSAASRSVSMSTDLNEYHDAFDDFDDEKTMTPNSSLPSDDELDQQLQEVMIEEEQRMSNGLTSSYHADDDNAQIDIETDEDDEDLESNCSALTVETITEQYLSAADVSQLTNQANFVIQRGIKSSRTRLPAPMIPRDQVSIWSILKNCIGKELSKITMPVVFNEPLTMLQRACEGLQYSHYLVSADSSNDPIERMEYVCAFIVAALSGNALRIVKPFNPLLYETYELEHELEDGGLVRCLAQQVSHHPPITAAYAECNHFTWNGVINPKIKFWGRSVEVSHDGSCRIYLKNHDEAYTFKAVACSIHNIIVGKLWFEHHGPLDIKCAETNLQANLVFKQAGWFSNDLHRFDGFISSGIGGKHSKKLRFVYGKWTDYVKSVEYAEYENYMKDNPQRLFRIPDSAESVDGKKGSSNSVNNNSISNEQGNNDVTGCEAKSSGDKRRGYTKSESTHSLDIPNSRTLWRLETQLMSEYYNFSLFTMKLNELTPELGSQYSKTDSRFRPDVRRLEEGDLDGAASEKQRLEEKQREARSRDKRYKDPAPEMLFFDLKNLPGMKDKIYLYKGGYWEDKCNSDRFPDLF